jgi:hypothetical protein
MCADMSIKKHNEKIPELSEEGYTDDDDYEDLILAKVKPVNGLSNIIMMLMKIEKMVSIQDFI